jgi:hypothetical protein
LRGQLLLGGFRGWLRRSLLEEISKCAEKIIKRGDLPAIVPETWRRDARKPDARPMSPGSQTRPAMMIVMSSRNPTERPPRSVNCESQSL